jgi:hypothetical protein
VKALVKALRLARICMPVKFPEISLGFLGQFFWRFQQPARITDKAYKSVR